MNEDEYRDWIDTLVEQGVYSGELGEDFKRQRSLFETTHRRRINEGGRDLSGAVGYVADTQIEASSVRQLVLRAAEQSPGRAIYFESLSAGGS